MSAHPIPYERVDTLFWSCVGTAPEWFVCDEEVVSARRFLALDKAVAWIGRHVGTDDDLPRILARGEDGVLYWVRNRNGTELVRLNSFGNPDFDATMPAYD